METTKQSIKKRIHFVELIGNLVNMTPVFWRKVITVFDRSEIMRTMNSDDSIAIGASLIGLKTNLNKVFVELDPEPIIEEEVGDA